MVHTKDGSRVVREFLAQGTAKVGCIVLWLFPEFTDTPFFIRTVNKSLKFENLIERMCLDDEAQLVLFTALDVIECVNISTLYLFRSYSLTVVPNSWPKVSYPLSLPPPPSYILVPKVVEASCISWFLALAIILPPHKSHALLKPTPFAHGRVKRVQKAERKKSDGQQAKSS